MLVRGGEGGQGLSPAPVAAGVAGSAVRGPFLPRGRPVLFPLGPAAGFPDPDLT
ncbi:hypothetical protein GCM10010231_11140 [Streptomyces sindenensis]|nr:hypothetical protein GCM10010231_11140 [Streptomyces sindenensis]